MEGRILFVSASGAPLTLFSMLPLTDKLKPKRHRNKTLGMFGGSYLCVLPFLIRILAVRITHDGPQ